CGQPGVLAVCRKLAAQPTPDNLDPLALLAILGGPEDARLVAALGQTTALGPGRFTVLGTYGHPALIDLVLAALTDADPATAAAAGSVRWARHGVAVGDPAAGAVSGKVEGLAPAVGAVSAGAVRRGKHHLRNTFHMPLFGARWVICKRPIEPKLL